MGREFKEKKKLNWSNFMLLWDFGESVVKEGREG